MNGGGRLQYRFEEFKDSPSAGGYWYPINVYYGSVYLGTLEAGIGGEYRIALVQSPELKVKIKLSARNNFETREEAVQTLHRVWKQYRNT